MSLISSDCAHLLPAMLEIYKEYTCSNICEEICVWTDGSAICKEYLPILYTSGMIELDKISPPPAALRCTMRVTELLRVGGELFRSLSMSDAYDDEVSDSKTHSPVHSQAVRVPLFLLLRVSAFKRALDEHLDNNAALVSPVPLLRPLAVWRGTCKRREEHIFFF